VVVQVFGLEQGAAELVEEGQLALRVLLALVVLGLPLVLVLCDF
jgi:hypothetical protein